MTAEKIQQRIDEAVELAIVSDADIDETIVKLERATARLEEVRQSR